MTIKSVETCRLCNVKFDCFYKPGGYKPKKPVCDKCLRQMPSHELMRETILDNTAETKTIEQRLRDVERWILEHKQIKHGYIPEPRF